MDCTLEPELRSDHDHMSHDMSHDQQTEEEGGRDHVTGDDSKDLLISSIARDQALVSSIARDTALVSSIARDQALVSSIARDQALVSSIARDQALVSCIARDQALVSSIARDNYHDAINLLSAGADPNLTNEAGFGLLQLAHTGRMVRILLDFGADPNIVYKCGYNSLSYHIKQMDCDDSPVTGDSILDLLIETSDTNIADKNGFTPLHHAIMKTNAVLVRKLVEHGADPTLSNEHSGESPLHQAVRRCSRLSTSGLSTPGLSTSGLSTPGSKQIVEMLLSDQRVPVSPIKKTGETPLHLAAWSSDLTCAFLLMRNGANVSARSKSGSTALHWAAARGDKDMIILLLVGGADPQQRDHFGLSSVMVADKRCGEEVSCVFVKYLSYCKQRVPTLLYLARAAYLWKRPILSLSNSHVTHNDQSEASHLPLPIRHYLKATDYQLMRDNMM